MPYKDKTKANDIIDVLRETFETMMEIHIVRYENIDEIPPSSGEPEIVLSSMLDDAAAVRITLKCNCSCAANIVGKFTGSEYSEVNGSIINDLREVTNIINSAVSEKLSESKAKSTISIFTGTHLQTFLQDNKNTLKLAFFLPDCGTLTFELS